MKPIQFQKKLLSWFDQHGRKNLPWQENKNPYRVWISEIMLQQTQVSTVIAYFSRFMTEFPTIQSLATAKEDKVLHLWTGLGYYSRARNCHRTAKIICEKFNGIFPDNVSELEKLPGIGRSTAGAIVAIAHQKPAAILDGNVKRVLTRIQGITEWPGEKKTHEQLWKIAETYTPINRIADYTQAIMDFGATICVRGKPSCDLCSFQKNCKARLLGIEKTLPKAKPKKILPTRSLYLILFKRSNAILLVKRPPTGIWGGLWSLPEINSDFSINEIIKNYEKKLSINHYQVLDAFRHTFSHFHLDITPLVIHVKKIKIVADEEQIWYNLDNPAAVGLPAPVKKLLERIIYDTHCTLPQT